MASQSPPEASPLSQPQETQTADTSNSDLMDLFQRRGAKNLAMMEEAHRERKHDVDGLSDRDLERITISLKSDGDDDNRHSEELLKRFEQYKHHSFQVKHWKPLRPDRGLDEEWFITDPDVLPEDDPGYLCNMCRHINFTALFTQRGLPGNEVPSNPTRIKLHGLGRVMKEEGNNCVFCRLLRRKIIDNGLLSRLAEDDIQDGDFALNVIDEGPDYALRLEVELEGNGRTPERFVVQRLEEESQQPLAGRFVQQDQADMNRLRDWLRICEETHGLADQKPEIDMASLRVIDTEELCIREVDMPCRYACLSYVWGKGCQTQYTTDTRHALEAQRGLEESTLGLPQTIKDAINVTQEAGLRYLWVDALCILQDDAKDKVKIISKMGTIYSAATLTIVASTNTDPQEGLPGIGSTPRLTTQMIANIQGITLAVALHDPRQPIPDIIDSVWSTRAWTFQEQALSTRSVHFTHSQMVFKCAHTTVMLEETVPTPDPAFRHSAIEDQTEQDLMFRIWTDPSLRRYLNKGISTRNGDIIMMSEDIDLSNLDPEMKKTKAPVFDLKVDAPRDFMSSLGDIEGGSTPWDMYRRAVDNYTKRKLTWESDAVNSFVGVEHIIRQGTNTKFWYGLPSFALEHALLWQAGEPLERRSLSGKAIFPSWSWAAWRGHVSYRGRGYKNSIYWEPVSVVRWMVREKPQWFIDRFKEDGDKTVEEVEAYTQQVAEARLLLRELNGFSLHHLDTKGKDGWTVEHDEAYNRHIYTHQAYQGVKFTYPVCLPGQKIDNRPDTNGMLLFMAHAIPIVVSDMKQASFKMAIEDRFFQIGINDEARSANYRPPWQRIIYHQGYRAGFLSLNALHLLSPEPIEDNGYEYHLVAITRGSLPHVPPPAPGWDFYWNTEPRDIQYHLFDEEWRGGPSKVNVPKETAEPGSGAQNENGDPHWDQGRFNGLAVFDVYNVLLLRTRSGISERIGAGKVSYCAFGAARPEEMLVRLA
ncbi:hypothetical protein D9758_008086 [Tetrapyrgos nigripes]|uniref:Heterokaryon incompatibility domain-containing protein n=1 Tax=Tetrapyrgos nigripes TaxID=182062 RepID=A0A8H5GH65_9AGAR|nr:hypothetical protein D9758_008086 [Tetrapyrgos nigripes]